MAKHRAIPPEFMTVGEMAKNGRYRPHAAIL